MSDPVALARGIIREQADALVELARQTGDPFKQALGRLLSTRQQVIVTGLGKSGLIARGGNEARRRRGSSWRAPSRADGPRTPTS